MPDPTPKPLPLSQAPAPDHAAKIIAEKIGTGPRTPSLSPQPSVLSPDLPPDQAALRKQIIKTLKTIFDPEIPLNIYDLGLVYKIDLSPTNAVTLDLTLTAPGCPVAGDIVKSVHDKINALPDVPAVTVNLVWEPAWSRDRLSDAALLELGLM
jgi:FeS assembly SUF system protein